MEDRRHRTASLFEASSRILSRDALLQLRNTLEHFSSAGVPPANKSKLFRMIIKRSYDAVRDIYTPISDRVDVPGYLRPTGHLTASDTSLVQNQFFANTLLLPPDFRSRDFDPRRTSKPRLRAVNSGSLIVTTEFDGQSTDHVEENLAWTRSGRANVSPLAVLDRRLRDFKDYQGYCAVFSGNRSVHFDFVFSTEHLQAAPFDASIEQRSGDDGLAEAALMSRVHDTYWTTVADLFVEMLRPSLDPDASMRSLVKWRRTPWAYRVLEKPSVIGLPAGVRIPQLVLAEDILSRAPRGATSYCVPPTFSVAQPLRRARRGAGGAIDPLASPTDDMFATVREMCRSEWGEYPALAEISQEGGEWVFLFRNHPSDQRPATIVRGDHNRLLIQGSGHQLVGEFYLPDGLTAQELGDYAARCHGALINPEVGQDREGDTAPQIGSGDAITFADLKRNRDFPMDAFRKRTERAFPEALNDRGTAELQRRYRDKLRAAVRDARIFEAPIVIRSPEGIGKTRAQVDILAAEAFDDAMRDDEVERFAAFAFRSREQADLKAQELRGAGRNVVSVKPFWEHHEEARRLCGQGPLDRSDLDELSPADVIARIRADQPRVFAAMEDDRRAIWTKGARFDGGTILLTLTHRGAALWPTTHLTRAWHHPAFDPDRPDQFQELANKFALGRVVFDDPEPDDFVLILPQATHEFIARQQSANTKFRHLTKRERIAIYSTVKSDAPAFITSFEMFDELMRHDLAALQAVKVDFDAIPFGYGRTENDIYRQVDGRKYFVGPRSWVSGVTSHMTFLTTEAIVTEVIEAVLSRRKDGPRPLRLDLTRLPGAFPISVPMRLDKRAAADRPNGRRVSALAGDILNGNGNAVVISDGTHGVEGVLSFQAAKGRNGLECRDISVIVTNLAPAKYAELNVLGQWLGRRDIIGLHYQDQIDQAVGRNRGFRHSDPNSRTQIVTSQRLWVRVLSKLNSPDGRSRLYLADDEQTTDRRIERALAL